MELETYMKDGMIDNWDVFEKVLDYSYEKVIISNNVFNLIDLEWGKLQSAT